MQSSTCGKSFSPGICSCSALCVPSATKTALKPVLLQRVDREVLPQRLVDLDLDAERADLVDLLLDHVLREAVGRDRDAQHAAGDGQLLEDRHLVALEREVARAGHARRPAADDRDLLELLGGDRRRHETAVRILPVGQEALEVADLHRRVDVAAAAGALAGVRADAADRRREGVRAPDDLEGLLVAARGGERHVGVRVDLGRAVDAAGGDPLLVDGHDAGDRLRVAPVDRGALDEPLVVLAGHEDRALLDAGHAAGALLGVDEARLLQHLRREVPRGAGRAR